MSFAIPLQADASNLLDQNCDDFFSGPGSVTLSTPVLPRHLMNTGRFVRKAAGTIQTPAVASGSLLERVLTTHPTTELEASDDRMELHETHPLPDPTSSSPPHPFIPPGPSATASVVGTNSITDPGSSRPSGTSSGSDPDTKLCGGPKSNSALSMASIITTKECGTLPSIESTSTLTPSHHPKNAESAQISRQPPIPAAQKEDKGPARLHGNAGIKPDQARSKTRGGGGLDLNITASVSRIQLCQLSWDIRTSG